MRGGEGSRAHGAPRCFPQQATCQVTPVQLQLWAQMPGCGAALREARGGPDEGWQLRWARKIQSRSLLRHIRGTFWHWGGQNPWRADSTDKPIGQHAQTGRGTRADGQRDGISTSQRADGAQAASAFSCQGFGEVSEAPGRGKA